MAIPEFVTGTDQTYLEYIMSTISFWANQLSVTSDSYLDDVKEAVTSTPREREAPEYTPYVPNIGNIRIDIPKSIKPTEMRKEFDAEFERLTLDLVQQGVSMVSEFFPAIEPLEVTACIKLRDMLAGDAIVDEQAVWNRTQTFVNGETQANLSITDNFVNVNSVAAPETVTNEVIHAGSQVQAILRREQVKSRIRIMLANLDFALAQVREWRQISITSMLGLISSYVSAAQAAGSAAQTLGVSQQPELISAVSQYRNALIGYEQLKANARDVYNTSKNASESALVRDTDRFRSVNQAMIFDRARAYATQVNATLGGMNAGGSVTHLVR